MTDVLQKFSTGSVNVLLWVMLGSWLMWPILCGVLGARRKMAAEGAMHGLFWGPFGLLVVLLKKPKHPCPTCGQRTLTVPAEYLPGAVPPPTARAAEDAGFETPPADQPRLRVLDEQPPTPVTSGDWGVPGEAAVDENAEKELEALHAWVNNG